MALKHTALRVVDIDAEVEFYREVLDLEVVRSFQTDDGTRNVFVGRPDPSVDDDAAVQFVESEGAVETGDFEHVALDVSDVDATLAQLDDERIVEGPTTLTDDDLRVAFIEDPEGWGIELIEFLE